MAEAGRYVLRDLFWDRRTNPVTETVPVFHRHVQGEVLDLDEAEATRLVDAGSVEQEGERERRAVEAARNQLRAALASIPDSLRGAVNVPSDEELDRLADEGIPQEALTVHTAPGYTNPGHPKYAAAAHGEGGGEQAPDADVGKGGPDEAPVATTAELDATQASLDDAAKATDSADAPRRARRERQGRSSSDEE